MTTIDGAQPLKYSNMSLLVNGGATLRNTRNSNVKTKENCLNLTDKNEDVIVFKSKLLKVYHGCTSNMSVKFKFMHNCSILIIS